MSSSDDVSVKARWQADRERFRQKEIAENIRVARPIMEELRQLGFAVESIADLYNLRLDYRAAIPVLLKWLPRIDNPDVKETIVRALTVRWARPTAAGALVEEFRRAHDPTGSGLRWAIGNALEVVADESVFEDLVEFVRDKRYGPTREMVAMALGRMKDPRAVDVLIEALGDEEIAGHAIAGLARLKAERAAPHIEPFLHHPNARIRREAKGALARIAKARESKSER